MPHIELPPLPGVVGLLAAYPQTAAPINALIETLLRGPSPLSPAERESIAAAVSEGNECAFCAGVHGAVARELGAADQPSPLLAALLAIAEKVRVDGRTVSTADVAAARAAGADDRAIHDTVLIAAAFCMINRYVDGLATLPPPEPSVYAEHGRRLATQGYL